jgi:hypothetical protein
MPQGGKDPTVISGSLFSKQAVRDPAASGIF